MILENVQIINAVKFANVACAFQEIVLLGHANTLIWWTFILLHL